MPSATATLFLNLTAIQQLCKGPRGYAVLNGYTPPTSSVGLSGDFYFNVGTTYPPLQYDLYGPKGNVNWPGSYVSIPTRTLLSNVSGDLNTTILQLSAQVVAPSSVNIINNNTSTALQVTQLGTALDYNVANFADSFGNNLTITNSGTVAFFYPAAASAPAPFSVNKSAYFNGYTTVNSDLNVIGTLTAYNGAQIGTQLRHYTFPALDGNPSSQTEILTMGVPNITGSADARLKLLSAYTAVFLPVFPNTNPVLVHNTRFEVGSGNPFTPTPLPRNGAFFIVDPVSNSTYGNYPGVTVFGYLTAINGYFTSFSTGTLSASSVTLNGPLSSNSTSTFNNTIATGNAAVSGNLNVAGVITGSTGASIPVSFGITALNGFNFSALSGSFVDNVYTVPTGKILIPQQASFIYDTATGTAAGTDTFPTIQLCYTRDHGILATPVIGNNGTGATITSKQYQTLSVTNQTSAYSYLSGGEAVAVKLVNRYTGTLTALSGRVIITGLLI